MIRKKNSLGQIEFELAYDGLGNVVSEKDGLGREICYHYLPKKGQNQVIDSDGKVARDIKYDIWGRPDIITDGMGNETHYTKDSWGRVVQIDYPNGATEHYQYNYAGKVTKCLDGLGNSTEFNFNANGNLIEKVKADKTKERFGYDKEGRRTYLQYADGTQISVTYNLYDDFIEINGKAAGEENASQNNINQYDAWGFLTASLENGKRIAYTYDKEGQLIRKESGNHSLYEASYDPCGRLHTLDGSQYTYDEVGRLASLEKDGIKAEYSYDAAGRQSEIRYGNGLISKYIYDGRNQITGMETGFVGKMPLLKASYTYDDNGNRIGKQENRQAFGNSVTEYSLYEYDSMGQLTLEEVSNDAQKTIFSSAYTYDLAGNRLTRARNGETEQNQYNERNQLVEKFTDALHTTYDYDPAGNLTEVNERETGHKVQYSYDAFRRCNRVWSDTFSQENEYDAEWYRDCKTEQESGNTKKTVYGYYYGLPVLEENEENLRIKSYALGYGYVGHVDETHKQAYYYVTDEQRSVRYVLDSEGNVVSSRVYEAFGEVREEEGRREGSLGYNSQIEDELTGEYYLRFRYYSPGIGRFTQEDVIYNDGLNLYAYCNSNPVMYCDPSGFASENLDCTCTSSKGKSDSEEDSEGSTGSVKIKVPTVKNGEFNDWFNSLSVDELDELWRDKSTRKAIERQLRAPGGMHEWHLVSRAPQFKYWGVSAEQIRDLRTVINDVEFVNPIGKHGQLGSTAAHNELLGIIDSSSDYNMFTRRLNNWANYRLNGGIDALPEGLRMK